MPFHIIVPNFKLLHFCNLTTFLQNPITTPFQLQISKATRKLTTINIIKEKNCVNNEYCMFIG